MPRHDRFIARAIEVAATSAHRWRVGCVIADGSRVMGHACNKFRNPPHIDHHNASLHAEAAALARCSSGDTAYVARVDRCGRTRLARPCEKCSLDLLHWGIRVVVFTSDDGGYLVEKIAA
jgi:tRNA(Arg) A34 adenosine deaminase TadA